ncbi:hypothetical protein G8T71_06565 [Clostridium botulinum C/D]|uniref:hypothetical protein n=1 Tax=Clostridium botulinum TaxID=1491 RepID=UPI001E318A73|nr:hypothetical protein [Clostridium botulinum]MCD3211017.1 hypothetical protein [Clostridium botulinum C/D]
MKNRINRICAAITICLVVTSIISIYRFNKMINRRNTLMEKQKTFLEHGQETLNRLNLKIDKGM